MNRLQVGRFFSALLLAACAGCGQRVYRAETELRADGSVRRAIFQPAEETPDAVQADAAWERKTYAAERPAGRWSEPIAALPPAVRDKQRSYFAAWGTFAAVEKLPAHVHRAASPGLPAGTLERDYRQRDYVLVVEHDWSETLTEIVALDDLHRACNELTAVAVEWGTAVLQEYLGDDYDLVPLRRALEAELPPWCAEALDAFYEHGARHRLREEARLYLALVRVCQRHGLNLPQSQSEAEKGWAAIEQFATAWLARHLRRKDGRPVEERVIAELVAALSGGSEAPAAARQRLDAASKRVVEDRFGGQQAMQTRIEPLVDRILGLAGRDFFGPPHRFHYTLEMPGPIVESTGTLRSECVVEWSFEALDAYPLGFHMQARALEAEGPLQQKLFGAVRLDTLAKLTRFVALVKADQRGDLIATLASCRDRGSAEPLRARLRLAKQSGDQAERERGGELEALLGWSQP